MKELKIGEYIRNEYGIAKIIDIITNDTTKTLVFDNTICYLVDKETGERIPNRLVNRLPLLEHIDISKIKHGDIIDLIEVGDYVDKLRVVDKYEDYIVVEKFDERIVIQKEDSIKSIVTREQFESVEYKI